jgi:hypothetical protein
MYVLQSVEHLAMIIGKLFIFDTTVDKDFQQHIVDRMKSEEE